MKRKENTKGSIYNSDGYVGCETSDLLYFHTLVSPIDTQAFKLCQFFTFDFSLAEFSLSKVTLESKITIYAMRYCWTMNRNTLKLLSCCAQILLRLFPKSWTPSKMSTCVRGRTTFCVSISKKVNEIFKAIFFCIHFEFFVRKELNWTHTHTHKKKLTIQKQ